MNIANAIAKRTTTIVLTIGGETVPGTIKRGLLAIENTKRTTTVTITVTATVVIRRATAITSATIRIGSTANGTVYTSRKALLALTWIS